MSFLLWLPLNLVIVSLVEYSAHRWLMHEPHVDAFWFPHAMHHSKYYRQFNHEPNLLGKYYNLRITWSDTLLACVFASPLLFLSVSAYLILFVLALLHRWTWNAIHSEMHLNEGRWFSNLKIYKGLRWLHFLHHRHPGRNFNVTLPLFDWVFRTQAIATKPDLEEWVKINS